MSYTNILEGARQYFQGLPSANASRDGSTPNPTAAAAVVAPVTSTPSQQPPVQATPPQAASVVTSHWPSTGNPADARWVNNKTPSSYLPPPAPAPPPPQAYPPQQYNNVSSPPQPKYQDYHKNNFALSNYPQMTSLPSSTKTPTHNNIPPGSGYHYDKTKLVNSYLYNQASRIQNFDKAQLNNSSNSTTPSGVVVNRNHHQQQHQQLQQQQQQHQQQQQQLLDMHRQNSNDNRQNISSRSSSSTSHYPTMGTAGMDRAFAQHYAAKLLPNSTTSAPVSRSNEVNLHNFHSMPKPSSTPTPTIRHTNSSSTMQYPQQYPIVTMPNRAAYTKTSASSQQQQQQQMYNEQKLTNNHHQHIQQQQQQQLAAAAAAAAAAAQQSTKQQYKLAPQYMAGYQQQYPAGGQFSSPAQYPTMSNPTASWVQAAMGQQYSRQLQQAQQSQQNQHAAQHFAQPQARQHQQQGMLGESSHVNSAESGHPSNKEMPTKQDLTSHLLLQPPKAPPPVRPPPPQARPGARRDSPLDLSVRTIRRSADSTLDDERGTPDHSLLAMPDTTRHQDLSLPSLLRSSEPSLPSFRPSFRANSSSSQSPHDAAKLAAASSLLSLEQKFGPRVSAPAETLAPLVTSQYMASNGPRHSYHPHREGHATPHLAAHALAQQQQQQHFRANHHNSQHPAPVPGQFRPNSGHHHSAADKRVLSILRESLEIRSGQHKLMLAGGSEAAAASQPRSGPHQVPRVHHLHPEVATMLRPPSVVHPDNAHSQVNQGPELDGLAAFLAARIRTKAELKQSLQASSVAAAAAAVGAQGQRLRRPQDCSCLEENCTCLGKPMAACVSSRKVSETRSSTETSVFDFPDSDPEMAAPASVGDLRRNRKPPSIEITSDCVSTPGPSAPVPAPAPPAPPIEEDPMWASLCNNFVTSLETKGAKTSRAGLQALQSRKRKSANAQDEPSKIKKTEIQDTKSFVKPEPEVSKEELELIKSCVKVSSDCGAVLETITPGIKQIKSEPNSGVKSESVVNLKSVKVEPNSDSDVGKKGLNKRNVDSSSDEDFEDTLSLAVRQQQRLQDFPVTSESSDSSSEDSDWSDAEGKAVAGRLRKRTTRSTRGRGCNISTRLRSNQTPQRKRPGRPRRKIVKSPSSQEESSREKSASPKPRKTRQKGSASPVEEIRRTRRKSKSPVPIKRRNKSKSPIRKKSKSPISLRNSRRKSKSPESKVVTPKKSKSPLPPIKTRNSRKKSKSPETNRDPGFYPGWESELVKFKQSLRMPSNLISIHSRPNSDPPTPTKKRRGYTNSPISCASDPGFSNTRRSLVTRKGRRDFDTSDSSTSTPVRKTMIRDVELSDSSNSLVFRPRRSETIKTLNARAELFAKLTDKIKGKGGRRKKADIEESKIIKEVSDDDKKVKLRRGLRQRRRSSRLSGSLEKRSLRSAAMHRMNRAVINSKKHLRRRDMKASADIVVSVKTGLKRGPKGRRKLRSSGFDYLRKKKKKKDLSSDPPKRVIGIPSLRQSAGSIEEIEKEVRGWVVNKGLGETVLHRAARQCHNDVVAYCLEMLGMEPSPRDNAGYTPLHEACVRGHLSTAKLLLLYGARVDSSAQGGIRPLHEAADGGHLELLRLLLSYGADPLLATYNGQTPLTLASNPEARRLLEGHLADVQGRHASAWVVPPHWGSDCLESCGFNVLVNAPASPNSTLDQDFDFEEISLEQLNMPATWWLPGETEPVMLLFDICSSVGHGPEWLKRRVTDLVTREISRTQFLETARPVHLLASDWKISRLSSSNTVTIVHLDEKLNTLLESSASKSPRAAR